MRLGGRRRRRQASCASGGSRRSRFGRGGSLGCGGVGRRLCHRAVGTDHHGLHFARTAVGHGIVGGGHGDRLGAADGLRRRRGEIGGRDRRGRAAGIGRRRQRGHRDILLPRHETLGLRLVAILEPVVDQLVFVRKILAARIIGKLLHRPAVGRDQGRLLAAKTAAALLVGEGQGAAESDGAEQRAAHHEGAAAFERHP